VKESKIAKGRTAVFAPNNKGINSSGYVLKSRFLMEQHLGRDLFPDELVHHINGNKKDNRIENYSIQTRSNHTSNHNKLRRKYDYELIKNTIDSTGYGYKRIAKMFNIPISSSKDICKKLKLGT